MSVAKQVSETTERRSRFAMACGRRMMVFDTGDDCFDPQRADLMTRKDACEKDGRELAMDGAWSQAIATVRPLPSISSPKRPCALSSLRIWSM